MTQNIASDINNIKYRNRKFIGNSTYVFDKCSSNTYVCDQYLYKQSYVYIFIKIYTIHIWNCETKTMTNNKTIYKVTLSCSEFF